MLKDDRQVAFHVSGTTDHVAVTFYEDGTCELHWNNMMDIRRWFVVGDIIYLSANYPLVAHFQEAYQFYLADKVLLA